MILDQNLTMSNRQALVGTDYSTNTIDLGQAYPQGSDTLFLYVHVISSAGTLPTLSVELETSNDNSTFIKVFDIKKPENMNAFSIGLKGQPIKRYVRLRHVLGGGSPSFNLTAGLVVGQQMNEAYPDSPRQA